MAITRVWIEDGCIACGACETICPEVFVLLDDQVRILGDARVDGVTDDNRRARSPCRPAVVAGLADRVVEAAETCPVEVIRWDESP
jgi:ferredoxin